jgi:predicted permease
LLARSTTRAREFAIRLAIGAGRARVIRQLLVESILLSALGAVLGLLLAFWADRFLLNAYLPSESTGDLAISSLPDFRVLAFTLIVMLVTALLFGLIPALQSSRSEIAPTLKNQAGSVVAGNVPLRKALVALQVTLSLLLLIGAGLFMRTLANLRNLHPGFNPEHLLGFEIDPSLNGYTAERSKIFYNRLTDELRAWESSMTVQGYTVKAGEHPLPYMNSVSPDYFSTMGIPVLAGRDFTRKDTEEIKHGPDADDWSPTTILINEKFAKKYFKGRNPIGMHLGFGSDPGTKTDMEVIGVVADVKYNNLRDETPVQAYTPYLASHFPLGMTVYVRTTLEPEQLMPMLRHKVQQLDANIPVYAMRTTEAQIGQSLRTERLVASLSSIFGILATLLAVVGLYGVMAYTVARRTREIGIRMALGALQGNVLWMVMKEVALLIGLGAIVGVPLAIGLSRFVQSQLYGLPANDPLTLAAATITLVAVAGLAGFVPAVRASRIDPTRALRYE